MDDNRQGATPREPMTPQVAERYLAQIISAIDDIREEGFTGSDSWYALDRFMWIAKLASDAAEHPEAATPGE